MQDTRQRILKYLNTNGEASVDELQEWLDGITAVTVRHHLNVLRRDGLVATQVAQRSGLPGRPKHIYSLTSEGSDYLPKNYRNMTNHLLEELSAQMPPAQVNVIFEGVGQRMGSQGPPAREGETLEERLKNAVEYLNEHGYSTQYEPHERGFLLHLNNCPYDRVEGSTEHLCLMDVSLISMLLGVVPRQQSLIIEGDTRCTFYCLHSSSFP